MTIHPLPISKTHAPAYPAASRVLHWLVAVLVLVVWPAGFVIEFVKDEAKSGFYLVHESLGFLVLWLMLARTAVRLVQPPAPAALRPRAERVLAGTVHGLLYAALLAQPMLGFMATNAYGFPLDWFGLVPVWSPLGKSNMAAPLLGTAHYVLGWTILALLTLHICGVLYHHVVRRDDTLQRML